MVALAARILAESGEAFTAVSVHFDWVKDDGYRFEQARETIRRIKTLKTPWIVLGDFNDIPGSRTMNAFMQLARDSEKPIGQAATYPADDPRIEIDYIIAGPVDKWRRNGGGRS